MWAMSSSTPRPISIPGRTKPRQPNHLHFLTVSAKSPPPRNLSQRKRNDAVNTGNEESNVKGLGKTLLSAFKSNDPKPTDPNSNPKQLVHKHKQDEGENQISGSVVLRALQRAAAQKKETDRINRQKKNSTNKMKRGDLSSVVEPMEEYGVDHRNVRPLTIKSEWGVRLSELEKRLQDLSDTI